MSAPWWDQFGRGVCRSRGGWAAWARAVVVLVLLAAGGCDEDGVGSDADEPAVSPVTRVADRDVVRLEVTASRDSITIAEELDLLVTMEADAGIEIRLPEYGATPTGLEIRDVEEFTRETLSEERLRRRVRYALDALVSGTYVIPSLTGHYRDWRGLVGDEPRNNDQPWVELTVEPIEITVTSLLEGAFDPQAFRDVKPVLAVPVDRDWRTLSLWGGGGLAALVLLGLLMRMAVRRVMAPKRVRAIPPHEWALGELRALAAAQLIESGEVKTFYYRLNEIARTYIELRFGLMAPERTTEEFLREMQASRRLPEGYRAALTAFLKQCDMVKYACYQPGTGEIEAVFNTARDFIEATRADRARGGVMERADEAAAVEEAVA